MDQLTVPMLADEDMRLSSTIGQRHHELPAMPKGDNDAPPLPIEFVHLVASLGSDPDDPAQESDQSSADRRKQREFQPIMQLRFLH